MVLLILPKTDRFAVINADLHSNMVLLICFFSFMCNIFECIYIPIWFYLYFKSKSILYSPASHLHSNMVLLIFILFFKNLSNFLIYIPIWFYLYITMFNCYRSYTHIYIPIWFYLY